MDGRSLPALLGLARALLQAVPEAADELVSGGLMSVCTQVYFQVGYCWELRSQALWHPCIMPHPCMRPCCLLSVQASLLYRYIRLW